jgi:hypothetical protein
MTKHVIDHDEHERLKSLFLDNETWNAMSDDEREDWDAHFLANVDLDGLCECIAACEAHLEKLKAEKNRRMA